MCKCGCRGWCTWFPIILALAWDLGACAVGGHTSVDEYGNQWDPGDLCILGFVLAVIEIRADWPAWCSLSGTRIWKHARFPCPKCDMPASMITNVSTLGLVTLTSGPWEPYLQKHYLEDVAKHKIVSRPQTEIINVVSRFNHTWSSQSEDTKHVQVKPIQ